MTIIGLNDMTKILELIASLVDHPNVVHYQQTINNDRVLLTDGTLYIINLNYIETEAKLVEIVDGQEKVIYNNSTYVEALQYILDQIGDDNG